MAIRNPRDKSSLDSARTAHGEDREVAIDRMKKTRARKSFRKSLVETLEDRKLMAVGPQLIGIQPNNSDLIENGVVRDVAPRELTFRFDDTQIIDQATTSGIRLTRSGGDGSFGRNSVATDFGSNGKVDIQLTMQNPGQTLTVNVTKQDLGSQAPILSLAGTNLSIILNSNIATPTTAAQLVNAIQSTPNIASVVRARINGGFADAKIGTLAPNAFGPIAINKTNDIVIQPGSVLVGNAPSDNEVTLRFAESLPDDFYRIEVFGFDDPGTGIVGLKNVATPGMPAQFFQPSVAGTRQETVEFRLDLGARVTGVVPQPVVRNTDDSISQLRDTIVVYFDNDKLLVENDPATGKPTVRSAENPDFYKLIYTADTVRSENIGDPRDTNGNADDKEFLPNSVTYNASNNTATLKFASDIDLLRPTPTSPRSAYRLRIGTRESIPFEPTRRTVGELGNTFTTADNLGTIGSASTALTSLILSSEIRTTTLGLDRLGASNDPGHRDLGIAGFENHINELFGADSNPGITSIFYNFKSAYVPGFVNSITELQKERIREGLQIWSNYLGVQFTESPDLGITFANGVLAALPPGPGVQVETALNFSARIDPTFNNSLLLMNVSNPWNNNFGETFFKVSMTGIGMLLGLEHAADLPDSTLMSLNTNYLNALPNVTTANIINFEPIFPGTQDVLHGQHVHRPDNSDIDLYRFEVNFGAGSTRTGEFVAESFAERSVDVSSLDTYLRLYKQKQATAVSNFNAIEDLAIQFTAREASSPGQRGNHIQIAVSQSPRGVAALPLVQVPTVDSFGRPMSNLIQVDLNSTPGSETTAAQLIAALQGNASANALVEVVKLRGPDGAKLGARDIVYSPISLLGGGLELVSQNDDYFSEDSLMRLSLGNGVYYVGVSASGNNNYDPAIPDSGAGGRTEGKYDLRLSFRSQTDANDAIQDTIGTSILDPGVSIDGDGDGLPGGVFNFWFETRALNRVLSVDNSGTALDNQVITITGSGGAIRNFELSTDASTGLGNVIVPFTLGDSPSQIATSLANAINGQAGTGLTASANGTRVTLVGDRTITFSPGATGISAEGKTIFVDKLAGPNADGSLAKPFNNIQNPVGANAFGAAIPGDIVRIVGNGGGDRVTSTVADNFAYEFGFNLIGGAALSDGTALEVPKGVIAMIEAGAVFKSRRSYIAVGSSNTGVDRSNANLQVLGTPLQPIYFTSWLDESIGRDSYGPSTNPSSGDWGGIIFQRDVDRSQGRLDKEDEGIFLNYVNYADIRYGGGSNVIIDSVQRTINPIQVVDGRPTITYNTITQSADAAISATPDSFEETLFTDLRYQSNGAFTPDYDRVGPSIHHNRLTDNTLNGLFIKIQTLPGEAPRSVSLAGRFDDIDVTHILTENLIISGTPGGAILDYTKPDAAFVTVGSLSGGKLSPGNYNYRIAFVDRFGVESVESEATTNTALAATGSFTVSGLPGVAAGFSFVRVYRSDATGNIAGTYTLVAQLDSTQNSFVDRGQDLGGRLTVGAVPRTSVLRPRLDASLIVDPGAVVKIEGARIELGHGVQFLAEGTGDSPIVFTSKLDDRSGAGGTFDTNNDQQASQSAAGNWGGIYAPAGSDVSFDHVVLAYGGGVTRLEGTFRSFNVLELQQGTARIANSTIEFNANGIGGQGPVDRFGRLANEQAVVFARGTSPIFIDNTFQNNSTSLTGLFKSSAITIDSNSLNNELQGDRGRQSGDIDRLTTFDFNRGPLFRGNSFNLNDLNGLKIRADNRARNTTTTVLSIDELTSDGLTVESVWDDTDIVHILFDGIFVSNLAHVGGLRLQSSPTESLVVKLSGAGSNFDPLRGSGFTAGGFTSSIDDRVGGTIHVLGQPGFPVIITSLQDDTAGAGLRPDGKPQNDTNNDGIATIARPGDWRGILLDQNSNDRNVQTILEAEAPNAVAPGVNGSIVSSQVLGQLATNGTNSDENLSLGFVVKGVLSQPEDIDVYSFSGVAGTEVWIDIDNTKFTLDTVVELLDANGNLLASSDNSGSESAGTTTVLTTPLIQSSRINPLQKQVVGNLRFHTNGQLKEDGTTNPRDAGLRVVLPGASNTRSGYFFRVRSASLNPNNPSAGLTHGSYEVQVRLREAQEFGGSRITGADIRYATNGIHVRGLPGHSPLLGEASEDESARGALSEQSASNDLPFSYNRSVAPFNTQAGTPPLILDRFGQPFLTGNRPQYVGNILKSDRGVLSVAGNLAPSDFTNPPDVDFYRFSVTEQDVLSSVNQTVNLSFDLDYADGLNRADASLAVYRLGGTPGLETWELIYVGEGSNIAEDQLEPVSTNPASDFSRGSFGTNDPFVNTHPLSIGEYVVAVTGSNIQPFELQGATAQILAQDSSVYPRNGGLLPVNLTAITAAQQPRLTFVYNLPNTGAGYTVSATVFGIPGLIPLGTFFGSGTANIDLSAFAGQTITISFPVVGVAANIVEPSIYQVFVLANLGPGVERVPYSRLSTAQLQTLSEGTLPIPSPQEVPFDLSGYSASDLPAAYFRYNLSAIDYDVTVVTTSSTTAAVFETPLVLDSLDRQAKIDLRAFAGQSNLKLVFTPTGVNPAASVQRVMIGFAERGEAIGSLQGGQIVLSGIVNNQDDFDFGPLYRTDTIFSTANRGTAQPLFVPKSTITTNQQTGPYQLEIRRVDRPTITDTNDRDSNSLSIVVPSGAGLNDGDTFRISDGANSVDFEFNSAGNVQPGRIPISFVKIPTPDGAHLIATRIRDAINSPVVQARLNVRSAGGDGNTATTLTGSRVNLFGAVSVTGVLNVANGSVIAFSGNGDANVNRDQGQVLISGNFIRHARDYGVWSEAGLAEYDPRDRLDFDSFPGSTFGFPIVDDGPIRRASAIIQSRPRLTGSSPGPVRNLQTLNNTLVGGFMPGVVISNNVLENGGLGGVHVAGENPIWMITPGFIPAGDHTNENVVATHFGSEIDDGDLLFIDSGRTRVGLEFEDIAGAGTAAPNFGSGQVGGNGVLPENVPVYYREDTGASYLRGTGSYGYSALESVHAIRDAILGSILVTNGTTQNVTATVGMSLLAPERLAQILTPPAGVPTFFDARTENLSDNFGLNWANRPAVYVEGATNIYFRGLRGNSAGTTGFNSWDIRRVDRAESPQPFARIVNNTVIGNDGRAGFADEPAPINGTVQEPNDILTNASPTQIGTSATQVFTVSAQIGDNNALANRTTDVDFYRIRLNAGERIRVDVDTTGANRVDTALQIYDANGGLVSLSGTAIPSVTFIENQAAPGEPNSVDPYLDFVASTTGVYYIAVSASGNVGFDPNSTNNRLAGTGTGNYQLQIALTTPAEDASSNDHLADATQTRLGIGISPLSYTQAAAIGDNLRLSNLASDVDLYQVKLDIGDRLIVDIDTVFNPNPQLSAVDTVLQLFDSNGRLVNLAGRNQATATFVDNLAAPGETLGIDPYLDYTAKAPGVYYVAISGLGNTAYDPQSSATRNASAGVGLYSLDIAVTQPNEFVISVDDESQYQDGDIFTIYQVADLAGQPGTTSRRFRFTTTANYPGPEIPVYIGPNYFTPDIARAIATAINASGLTNAQGLDNGLFGTANPLNPVSAVALGGIDGVETGLRLFPLRSDGFVANPLKHSFLGIGHNRTNSNGGVGSEAFGTLPTRAFGDGTSEKFVVVRNAASIESTPAPRGGNANRRSIRVDPDRGANYNMNQLIPESGILISAGVSPTVLNNVFYNVQTPIVKEESRSLPPSLNNPFSELPLVFGTTNVNAVDRTSKPTEIIVGGNVYQFIETQVASNRNGFGIQDSPTNIANTQNDFNFVAANSDRLFVNPQAGNYLPAANSRLIDSSIDSLPERAAFNSIKSAAGIAPSPVLAPSRDAYGQLRVDDPKVAPPQGLGANIFKDRGALDRADFTGPNVRLLRPIDNDSELIDRDGTVSYVQLTSGIYPEFRFQLSDIGDTSDPFPGVGIDDNSVVGPDQAPLRPVGAVLTITENGRPLREGIDYVFAYSTTTKEIVLTPLAGVWRNDRVYDIKINNRDRFVLQAPSGNQVADGQRFSITDDQGGIVHFEFDSGYRIQLPNSLRLILPLSGGGPGGVQDGELFTITSGGVTRTFEFDRNGNSNPNRIAISFLGTDTQEQLTDKVLAAILSNTAGLGLSPRKLPDGSIFLGGPDGSNIGLPSAISSLSLPIQNMGIQVPPAGPLPGGVQEGQTFVISDGSQTFTFEVDFDNAITAGNIRVDISLANTAADVALAIFQAVSGSALAIRPAYIIGNTFVELGLPSGGSVNVAGSQLSRVGVSRTIADTTQITVDYSPVGGTSIRRVFEFDTNSITTPNTTVIPVSPLDTEDEIGQRLVQAIRASDVSLSNAIYLGNGRVFVGGTTAHTLRSSAASVVVSGIPGVTSSTQLTFGPSLVLTLPASGVTGIQDGSTITINDKNGLTVTFEFDNNNNWSSTIPGRVRVPYSVVTPVSTPSDIATALIAAIRGSNLAILPVDLGAGEIDLGLITDNQINIQPQTNIATRRQAIQDGQTFTIQSGNGAPVVFEFDNTTLLNGTTGNNIPIRFAFNASTGQGDSLIQIVGFAKTAIENAGLGLLGRVTQLGEVLQISDTPRFRYTSNTQNLNIGGLPGGAFPISFVPDASFTGADMQNQIVRAINQVLAAGNTSLSAIQRIDNSLFIDNAVSISLGSLQQTMPFYLLRGVQDLASNVLRPNRVNNETQFTIVMPGAALDFGDAPDPFNTTSGRYPTQLQNNGARHVVTGTSEIQVVGWTAGEAVTGSFILTHDGQSTSSLPVGASASSVQAALEGLSTIGQENVVVELLEQPSGSPNVSYRLNFRNLRKSFDVPQTTISLNITSSNATQVATFQQTLVNGVRGPRLGTYVSTQEDGQPSVNADTDAGDDGVTFTPITVSLGNLSLAAFSKNVDTQVNVSVSESGFLDAWIDFNADGDWDDPNEQVIVSQEFFAGGLNRAFSLRIPSTAPTVTVNTQAMARFRFSSEGGLLPTGLALDGEVEDYRVTLIPGNAPFAVADVYATNEDVVGGLVVNALAGVLTNDTDPDPGPNSKFVVDNDLSMPGIQPIVNTQNGMLVLNVDGSFSYQPNLNFFGQDTFVYRVQDGVLASVLPTTVTITVRPVNDVPIDLGRTVSLDEDEVYDVTIDQFLAIGLPNGATPGPTNESSQALTVTRVDATSEKGGTAVLSGGRVRYTPPRDFIGTDTLTYTITDNGITGVLFDPLSLLATITFNLSDQNDPPIVGNDNLNVAEEGSVSQPLSFFLSNDSPGEGSQSLTLTSIDAISQRGGTITLVAGVVTYQPATNFTGTDTFTYTVTDNGTTPGPRSTTGTVTVTVNSVNDLPTVISPFSPVNVAEDAPDRTIDLRTIFGDVDIATAGDVFTFTITSNSRPGLVNPTINNSTGLLNLAFLADQNGLASIVVRATDSSNASVENTLTVNVSSVPDSPRLVGNIQDLNLNEDAAAIDIIVNPNIIFDPDVLTDGDVLTITASSTNPSLVSAVITGSTLRLTITPNRSGQATITVRGRDSSGQEITDTFEVSVADVNDAPVVSGRSYIVAADGNLVADDATGTLNSIVNDNGVLAGATDEEGDIITAVLVQQPTRGQLTLNPNGTFNYRPNAGGQIGQSDTFTYRATDSRGAQTAPITITINFVSANASPHQNPSNKYDVNADGVVTPIDALVVINFVIRNGNNFPISGITDGPPPYRDVNGDRSITIFDVLEVINRLNRQSGEGESTGTSELIAAASGSSVPAIGTSSSLVLATRENEVLPVVNARDSSVIPTNSDKDSRYVNALVDSMAFEEDDEEDWLSSIVPTESVESAVDKFFSDLK
jgi:Bacterial Ig domain/Bacterial pre-peptidase C-terminal domain/Dockerin type I domain/GEVED domain